jgi:hypothetical protein
MTFKNYKIELNENYNVAYPESKFIFWNIENSEEPIGNANSIEKCVKIINDILNEQ